MATRPPFPLCRLALAALSIYGGACSLGAAAQPDRAEPPVVLAQDDPDAAPEEAQSQSGLLIRIERLEDRLRSMTGQVEQLQFQNRKLEDELRKMQQDVDFRFQDLGRGAPPGAGRPAPQKRGDAGPSPDAVAGDATPVIADSPAPPAKAVRRASDAFDADGNPNAPGAPKPLGTTPASEPLPPRPAPLPRTANIASDTEPHAPMNLVPPTVEPAARGGSALPRTPDPAPDRLASATPESRAPAASPGVASLVPGGTRSEYDGDFALYKGGQYDAAANGFQSFLDKYPNDRLAGDATYFLGESYARLGRHREAAEQFLKLSTDYTRSAHAPDALLRLGIALNAMGAKEQACATYQEVDRKFPTASADVRTGVERELKRARC